MIIPAHLRPDTVPIAPEQRQGLEAGFTGLRVHFSTEEEAKTAYRAANARFSNPASWFQSPPVSERFKLHYGLADQTGQAITGRGPHVGDFGRITVGTSHHTDWVSIEEVGAGPDMRSFTFRPSPAAVDNVGTDTAHFYERSASNTMTIWRDGNDLVSTVQLRNVAGNTGKEMSDFSRRMRNRAYWVGSELGGQKYMWDTWVGESSLAGVRATGKTGSYLLRPANVEGFSSFIPELYHNGAKSAITAARDGVESLVRLVH